MQMFRPYYYNGRVEEWRRIDYLQKPFLLEEGQESISVYTSVCIIAS